MVFKSLSSKERIISKHIQQIEYRNKTVDIGRKIKNSEKFTEEYYKDLIANNISYYAVKSADDKSLSKLPLAIQYDISKMDGDYK
jgi:hypothetical protein